jgi:putative membrane protein
MVKKIRRTSLLRVTAVGGGLAVVAALCWYTLSVADLALLFGSWAVPAAASLHLIEEAGCGYAWRNVVEPPRPVFGPFFGARWVRASVASLLPVSGVGGALAAVRFLILAGLPGEVAVASLVLDSTVEMATQIVFTAIGFGALLLSLPQQPVLEWAFTTLAFALVTITLFVAAQRLGALRLVEAGLRRLAHRWPRLLPLSGAQLHDRLMSLQRRRTAILGSGCIHLGCWLLGAGEVWVTLFALGHHATLQQCLIVESLGMTARSAGFFVPGALGIQEIALVMVGSLVGVPPASAMLLAIVKRLRDIVLGIPGLFLWQWMEGRSRRQQQLATGPS